MTDITKNNNFFGHMLVCDQRVNALHEGIVCSSFV